jgi:hypothetical protein
MVNHNDWKKNLKYYKEEKFWGCYIEQMDLEIWIQGTESEISPKHLSLMETILSDFERINQISLKRLYETIKSLEHEELRIETIHVFRDENSVTAKPVDFMITYGHKESYDSKGNYVAVARYTVKFMDIDHRRVTNPNPIAVEDWFI